MLQLVAVGMVAEELQGEQEFWEFAVKGQAAP